MQTKPLRASKTLWGLLLLLPSLLTQLWVGVSLDHIIQIGDSLSQIIESITALVGMLLAIYGRVNATKSLTL